MRRLRYLVAACAGLLLAPVAQAQAYPSKPVKLVVPFAPGGGNDVFARLLGQKLSEQWKQSVVVDNRPGAGGNVGSEFAAKSAPDGYTLLLGHTGTLAINPALYARMGYDPAKDLAPIAQLATSPLVLVVAPNLKVQSVKDLIALAKAGDLNFASSGNGTGSHLAGELFKSMARVKLTHVPYKGTSPALTDVLGGQVQFMFSVIPAALPHIKAGKLQALAVTGATRMEMLPGIPTVAESGLPGFESTLSYGLLAPKGTPDVVLHEIQAQVAKAAASPEFRERLAADGAEPHYANGVQFAALTQREAQKWAAVIRNAGLKPE